VPNASCLTSCGDKRQYKTCEMWNPQLLTLLRIAINRNGCVCCGERREKRDEGWDEARKSGSRELGAGNERPL
jgi:hypothetical protein